MLGAGNHRDPVKLSVPETQRPLQSVAVLGHWVRDGTSLDVTMVPFE